MGKAKRGRKKPKVTNPISVPTTAEIGDGDHVGLNNQTLPPCEKETEIMTVIEQLQSSNVEDKIFGLHSLATVFEDPSSVADVLQHKIVKVAGPLLVERSSFVRNAAAGALRNLSACGSHEICDLLVEQDVMTPLAALIQQYAADWRPSPKKKEGKLDEQVDTLVQSVHLLWNLCESNSRALKYFNDSNLLPILIKCLDSGSFGMEATLAAAHCLNAVSEDNPAVVAELRGEEARVLALVDHEGSGHATLLLRVLASSLLLNMNGGRVEGLAPTTITLVMRSLADALAVDQRQELNTVTSNMPEEKDEPTAIQEKMDAIGQAVHLLEAQKTAVEILANFYSDDNDDEEMDQDLSDTSDDMFDYSCEIEDEPSTTERFSQSVSSEVHEAIVSQQLVRKVWEKTSFPAENVCLILREHQEGKQLYNKVATLRCRALLCLNNLLSSLDIDDVGGADWLHRLWVDIGSLIFTQARPEDTPLLEAATAAMRAALQRLAEVKTQLLPSESDLTLMFNGVHQCMDAQVRANLIRCVGTLGTIVTRSTDDSCQLLLRNIGKFLVDVGSKEAELWVVAEALDTVMDVFGEDETDKAAAVINLVDKLIAILPSLKHKIRLQRKSLGEHLLIVTTVNTNLGRFIKYKSERIALIAQPNGQSNGNHS